MRVAKNSYAFSIKLNIYETGSHVISVSVIITHAYSCG